MDARETLERRIDELCKVVYLADIRIEELEAENERLRQDNAKLRGARDVWQENDAMLRELVRDMWAYITEPVGKRNNLKERLARFDDIADRMRELGIPEEA